MKNIRICDTHNDFLTELKVCEIEDYINRCEECGVEIISASYWSSEREEAKIEEELTNRSNALRLASKNYLLHIEDLWWVKNKEKLKFLLDLKPFSCSLTWNFDNALAGGSKESGGLTMWGERCLKELIESGIAVDLAHLNRKSFYQVARLLKNKLYCSHTGFYGVKRHKRNLTDKQIDMIVKSGGFIGLFFYDKCLQANGKVESLSKMNRASLKLGGGQFNIDDIVKSLNYFTLRWGFDNIGIGSDFYGIENYPKGLENYEDFPNLLNALVKEGYNLNQIDKIFYTNFKNIML